MKTINEINSKITYLKEKITSLEIEIKGTIDYHIAVVAKVDRKCDTIIVREFQIAEMIAEIKGLEWVMGE